jgi:hypothetical protein
MFCPNCGANNTTEQKFCRACGLNLEGAAASLLEQIPSAEAGKLLKREKNLEKFGNFAFGGFAVVIFAAICAIIYWILSRMFLGGSSVFGGILMIAFLIFAGLTLTYVIFKEGLKEKKQKANPTLKNELAESPETGKLLEEKRFDPVPSIIENTTDLLPIESRARKLD